MLCPLTFSADPTAVVAPLGARPSPLCQAVTAIDVTAGLVLGYRTGPMPLVVPSVKLHENVRLTFLPPIEKISGAVHLSIERKF